MHHRYLTLEQRESLERLIRARPGAVEAVARLRTPEYGVCRDCGRDIPYVRLMESPTAERCAVCDHQRTL